MSFGSDGMFYDNNEYRKTADKRSYSAVPYNPGTDIVVAIGFLLCVPPEAVHKSLNSLIVIFM